MNDFVFFGEKVVDLFGLFAHAFDRAASARVVVDRPAVVVAELDQHEIARPHRRQDLFPHKVSRKIDRICRILQDFAQLTKS
jgi:hypothetical protein